MHRRLIQLARMLRDQLAHHFEMTELLDGDVLEHVPDESIFDVERLHPILQRRSQFSGGPSKLLEEICAKARVRLSDIDGLNQFFAM